MRIKGVKQDKSVYVLLLEDELNEMLAKVLGLNLNVNLRVNVVKALLRSNGDPDIAASYLNRKPQDMPRLLKKFKVGYTTLRKKTGLKILT
jgi:hypothetical protein